MFRLPITNRDALFHNTDIKPILHDCLTRCTRQPASLIILVIQLILLTILPKDTGATTEEINASAACTIATFLLSPLFFPLRLPEPSAAGFYPEVQSFLMWSLEPHLIYCPSFIRACLME